MHFGKNCFGGGQSPEYLLTTWLGNLLAYPLEEIIILGIISTSNRISIGGWAAWRGKCVDGCTPSKNSNKSANGRRQERYTSPQTPLTRKFPRLSSWMLFLPSWLPHVFYPTWTWSPSAALAVCPNRPIKSLDPSSSHGTNPCKGFILSSTSSNKKKEEEANNNNKTYLFTHTIFYLSISQLICFSSMTFSMSCTNISTTLVAAANDAVAVNSSRSNNLGVNTVAAKTK